MPDNHRGIHDIYGPDGRLLFLGMETFVLKVVKRGGCFVCGKCDSPAKTFNQEHIIPRWLMGHAGIANQRITLMNGESLIYGEYKIPICASCNSDLGGAYEDRISPKLKQGFEVFKEFFRTEEGRVLTYQWLCLLLIKCMLKDCRLARVVDRRVGLVESIGDAYLWHRHHHLLCVARSAVTGVRVSRESIGSIFLHRADSALSFDFGTLPKCNAIKVQIGDIVLMAVLDDAGIAAAWFRHLDLKFPEKMDKLQVCEFMLMAALAFMKVDPKPVFGTNWHGEFPEIGVKLPEEYTFPCLGEVKESLGPSLYAQMLREGLLADYPESVHRHISKGEWTFFPGNSRR